MATLNGLSRISGTIEKIRGGLQWRQLFLEAQKARDEHAKSRYARTAECEGLYCAHKETPTRIVRRETAAGIRVYAQCLQCGFAFGQAIALRSVANPDDLPLYDQKKAEEDFERKKLRARNAVSQHEEAWQAEEDRLSEAWWSLYNQYLASTAWLSIRTRVIERADNRCEGCRTNFAQHVHHLTYERVGWELLYDLVALCRDCHDRAHGKFEQ